MAHSSTATTSRNDQTIPRYRYLANSLRQAIRDGEFDPGDPLPSEHQLCATWNVSRPTVRKAIDLLAEDGLVVRRHGMGTFIARMPIVQPAGRVIGFSERMQRLGMTPSNRVLAAEDLAYADVGSDVRRTLSLEPGSRVFRLSRVRLANDDPVVLETIHLPLTRFPALTDRGATEGSIYAFLQETYGVQTAFLRESLEPVIISAHEATLLHTVAGTPAILARIVTFDQHGVPIEHSLSLVHGKRCQYEFAFVPGEDAGGQWHVVQTQLEAGATR